MPASNEKLRERYANDPEYREKMKARAAEYYAAHKADPAFVEKLRTRTREQNRRYRKDPAVHARNAAFTRSYYRAAREAVFVTFGRRCGGCGEPRRVLLTLDHVHGGGTQDQKRGGQVAVWRRAVESGDRSQYRILCHNCQKLAYDGLLSSQAYSPSPEEQAAWLRGLAAQKNTIPSGVEVS